VTTTKLTIGLATPTGMSAPYAYPAPVRALGYDREQELELAFFYGGEPGATARALAAGACDIACLNTIVGFMGRANEGLPMLAIGSKARRAHRYFAVLAERPTAALAQLRGKRIACDFPHIQPLAEAALAEEGVPADAFSWLPWRGSGMGIAEMIEPLRAGEVDALFLMDWTDGDAVARGLQLRHLHSRLLERIRVSSCYWTTQAAFAARADALARALRAIQKSIVFSFANPQAALRMMWEVERGTKPAPAARDAVLAHDTEVLKACLGPMRIDPGDCDPRWCAISERDMQAWQTFLLASGTISEALDLDRLYTTALVEAANAFDADEVRAAARVYGG
jgi:NitT/TauT family transport system substrate-binding protein